jgi:methyl-accepting chemotaxis protein
MDNIRQASAQNVAGTKQAEAAAHNLSELGQKLKSIIGQYRIWQDEDHGQEGQ